MTDSGCGISAPKYPKRKMTAKGCPVSPMIAEVALSEDKTAYQTIITILKIGNEKIPATIYFCIPCPNYDNKSRIIGAR